MELDTLVIFSTPNAKNILKIWKLQKFSVSLQKVLKD